jgi:hypothetical protein
MIKKFFRRIPQVLFFSFAITLVIVLGVFDIYAKPQSDDWGWLELIKEYGYFGSYASMRETSQMSPYMLLVMFSVVLLQYYVPYGFLLFVIQMSLPISIFVFAKRYLSVKSKLSQLKLLSAIVTVNILIYLTAWNTNTHQNAIFWLTGALGYVLPLSIFIFCTDRLVKVKKTFFDQIVIIIFTPLLVSVQLNYVVIFGLIGIFLLIHKKIQLDYFFKLFVFWAILTAIYSWSYSSWLNRIQIGNNLAWSEKVINFVHLLLVGFLKEPLWSLSLFLLGIYLASLPSKNIYKHFIRIITWKVIAQATIVILVSAFLILVAFNGNMGYGRVQFLTHFMVVLFILAVIVQIGKKYVSQGLIPLGCLILSIGLFILPLKAKLWRAQRFSNAWTERGNIIEAQKIKGDRCVFVNKLPKSDLLGYSDLNPFVTCDSFVGCMGVLRYGKINFYDNWVHKQHYNLKGNIVIRDEGR